MGSLSRPARWYLIILWFVAACLLIWTVRQLPNYNVPFLEFLLWLAGYVLADYFEVEFDAGDDQRILATTVDAVIVFLVAVSGLPGVLVVALGASISDALHRRAWYRSLFNIAVQTIAYLSIVAVFTFLHEPARLPYLGPRGLFTLIAIAAIYHLLNNLLVGTIIALAAHQSLLQIYRGGLLLVRWVHFITLPLGVILATLWFIDRWLVIVGVVPLISAQRAFASVAAWQTESQRSQALAAEKARLYEELRHQQDELVRASKLAALGTFSAGIAHEFNNVLAAILGHAQLGLTSSVIAEKDKSLEIAMRACQRGRSITNGLLTFARHHEIRRELHQIRDVVEETLLLVEHELRKHHIRVERRLQPVPLTLCDQGQLVQVLLNLITNARDAMQERGGGVLTLDLSAQNSQIVLAISDTGGGISPAVQDQLFQPFVTTKEPGKGTGLGLSICYGIVESHGGSITFSSTLGQGTTVTVKLPITSIDPMEKVDRRE